MDVKKEVKITFTQLHFFIIMIILAHIAIPFALKYIDLPSLNYYSSTLELDGQEYLELDMQNADSEELQLSGRVAINNETIIIPDIYVFRYGAEKSEDNINDMLNMLAHTKTPQVTNKPKPKRRFSLKRSFLRRGIVKKKAKKINYEKILTKSEILKIEKSNLLSHIKRLNPKLQKCYSNALKNDELLTGKMNIQIYSRKVSTQFKGIGKHKSITGLKRCFRSRLAVLNIPSVLSRHKINFSVNLTGN